MLKTALFLALFAGIGIMPAEAQISYRSRPVTMIVPFVAGGPLDVVARIVADAMTKQLGQPIIIENVSGAGGNIGAARAARAEPDGHTILMYHIGAATSPALYRGRLPYDPVRDLVPLSLVNEVPMVLVGRRSLAPRSLPELLNYMRSQGSRMTFANAGIGSASHLCGLLLMTELGTELTAVPYRSTGAAMNDLIGGQVDVICDLVTNAAQQIRTERIRAYAVTSDKRIQAIPEIPTTDEAGLPVLDMVNWNALFAPKGTPPAIVQRLEEGIRAALGDPTVAARLSDLGTQPIHQSRMGSEQLQSRLASEISRWTPIIERSGQFTE